MPRPQQSPLRPLTAHERTTLAQVARSGAERADRVGRAKALLAVADGATFTAAARAAGRRSGDGVAKLVARFNAAGLAALTSQPSGRPPLRYGPEQAARILREVQRTPEREADGTATWSLTTLQRALRRGGASAASSRPSIRPPRPKGDDRAGVPHRRGAGDPPLVSG
jgi:transposase